MPKQPACSFYFIFLRKQHIQSKNAEFFEDRWRTGRLLCFPKGDNRPSPPAPPPPNNDCYSQAVTATYLGLQFLLDASAVGRRKHIIEEDADVALQVKGHVGTVKP